MKSHSTRTA